MQQSDAYYVCSYTITFLLYTITFLLLYYHFSALTLSLFCFYTITFLLLYYHFSALILSLFCSYYQCIFMYHLDYYRLLNPLYYTHHSFVCGPGNTTYSLSIIAIHGLFMSRLFGHFSKIFSRGTTFTSEIFFSP